MDKQAEILKKKVLQLVPAQFDALALEVFRYQAQNNPVYAQYLQYLGTQIDSIQHVEKIPFLPIEFFKSQEIITGNKNTKLTFESSGTTGQQTSRHYIKDPDFYLKVAEQIFEKFYGKLSDFQILALLPSYLERNNSSLVYMVEHFIKKSGSPDSGFFLNDYENLVKILKQGSKKTGDSTLSNNINRDSKSEIQHPKPKILLIGVTFGLLDFAEYGTAGVPVDLSFLQETENLIVMETGGMKGRRKELLREEVHEILTKAFHVKTIHSEYGMTELLSQGYSFGEGVFELPTSMKILLRDVNDPFSYVPHARSGGLNVIDLANIDSCSFIETKDLGSYQLPVSSEQLPGNSDVETDLPLSVSPQTKAQFRILGRFDNSDIRGCNLMIS
ncbi:MAG: acyl transferase [Arcicella sp.]|jgi:hypothetical protein|nr:acyl transferase [Arcicella sp.]